MRSFPLLLTLLVATTIVRANPVLMHATLEGETVYVHLQKEAAAVTAVYQMSGLTSAEPKLVYFPMFGLETDDPYKVLIRSALELVINGRPTGLVEPCAAPQAVEGIPAHAKVFWFAADIESLREASGETSGPIILRASYVQPRIHGRFYYIPLISGYRLIEQKHRSWRYQMHARSTTRMPQILSRTSDYEPLGDAVAVYLKNGELVELQ